MRTNIILILLIGLISIGADYVCYDKDGHITEKVYSKGASYSSRIDCMKVDRTIIGTITKYDKVDASIVSSNENKIVEMTQEEKDALDAPSQASIDYTNKITDLTTKLKGLGLTDEEVNIILNN